MRWQWDKVAAGATVAAPSRLLLPSGCRSLQIASVEYSLQVFCTEQQVHHMHMHKLMLKKAVLSFRKQDGWGDADYEAWGPGVDPGSMRAVSVPQQLVEQEEEEDLEVRAMPSHLCVRTVVGCSLACARAYLFTRAYVRDCCCVLPAS